ncbi:MAG: sugar phosphate isomerase/epimerase family protein [Thermogutta sp.]
MLRIRLAADLGAIEEPLPQLLNRMREMQLDGVELDLLKLMPLEDFTNTAIREIRKSLADRNLSLAAVRYRARGGIHRPMTIENHLENIKKVMELTYRLGGNVTIVNLGHLPSDQTSPDWQILREIVQDLCRFSERSGSVVAAETGRSPPQDFVALLDALPESGFGVDISPGELVVHDFDPVSAIETCGRRIVTFHATDAINRPGKRGYDIAPLGRGDIDYPAVLSALEKTNFPGFIILRPTGDHAPLEEIRRAKEFLYRL